METKRPSNGSTAWEYVDPVPSTIHTVHMYDDDAILVDETSRLLGAALGAGGAAVAAATAAHREAFARHLDAAGFDVARLIAEERYIALDAAELLNGIMPHGQIDERRFMSFFGDIIGRAANPPSGRQRRVTVYGELVALLAIEGDLDGAIALERCWNALATMQPFTLQCGYPTDAFHHLDDRRVIDDICGVHTAVIPPEGSSALNSQEASLQTLAQLQYKNRLLEQETAERVRADQALLERNLELQAAIRARDEFLYVASHELRTPITGLRGYAQLLLRDVDQGRVITPARLARSLAMFERQIYQLNQLVGRLIDTSQIQAGTLRLEMQRIDIAGLVRSAVEQLPPHERHEVTVEGPDHLEVMADPARMEHVVANLLDNAIKFSPDGGPVRVTIGDAGADGVQITMADNGLGVPEELREAVFTKFHQARPEAHLSGLGLGLYVCRAIVGLHGGTIRLDAAGGHGARVVVTLPSLVA